METNVETAIRKSGDIQRKFANQSQSAGDTLGKSDFLNLFMTQLSKQDPLDPMDSSKMMQQISQMGSMEQLQEMNKKLDTMNSNQETQMNYLALNYLNQEVSYSDDSLSLNKGEAQPIRYFVSDEASRIKINVMDEAGGIVAEEVLEDVKVGEHFFKWDGQDKEGKDLPDATYSVKFLATGSNGEKIDIDRSQVSRVSKIKFVDNRPQLLIDGQFRDASQVNLVESKPRFAGAEPLLADFPSQSAHATQVKEESSNKEIQVSQN